MLKNAKKIICLSKNYFNYSKELQKFKKKVIIIPPLINKKLSQKKYRRKKYINLISVGRIVDYKGYDIALKAISNLPENFKLRIIGSGDRELEINKLILELGIKNRVTVYKNVTDKIKTKMTLKSDIFLACSKSRAESFGIAILEAISLGMPLIISKVNGSGMNDMIINKYNGYFFRNNSATDCSKKIIKISNNINKLRLFSLNSKKIFNTKFNEKKTRQKLDKIYK